MNGTVKWFNNKLGYGFITDENNKDYFVHYKDVMSNEKYKMLNTGQKVVFNEVKDVKGLSKAVNVCIA